MAATASTTAKSYSIDQDYRHLPPIRPFRQRADFIVDSWQERDDARVQVCDIRRELHIVGSARRGTRRNESSTLHEKGKVARQSLMRAALLSKTPPRPLWKYQMRTVSSSATPTQPSDNVVTVERLERAIKVTARCMVEHALPQLLPILKRLEAERDRLARDGDALEYARRLLAA